MILEGIDSGYRPQNEMGVNERLKVFDFGFINVLCELIGGPQTGEISLSHVSASLMGGRKEQLLERKLGHEISWIMYILYFTFAK